ncbi:MAG: iron complex outermembrane recepter protein [Chitinophagaceae bacterium]|nr:MAG: iron complex outermembrane recepter protein [Chitinophagaceae bacterium]
MSKKLTLFLTLLAGTNLLAQKDSTSTKVLDEVVVTANKLEQKQSSTGKVITIIGKDQLDKSVGRTVAQVLNETAGITINGAYNNAGTNQSVFMRGAASGRTLILMDGIPVSDPSQINNEFDLNLFSINDVERIEICRGAQSTVYGSDAIAGVINIITIKPNANKAINLKATVSAGNLGTFRNSVQVYGKVKKLTYAVRSAQINTNGFSSASDTTSIKGFDDDNYHGNASSASAQYQLNDRLSVKAFGMYSAYKAGIDAGVFSDDKNYTLHNNVLNTGTGFQYKLPKITITGNYQFSQTNRNYERDSADKAVFSYYLRNAYFAKTQFAELYATLPINANIHLLQGIEYRYANMNNNYNSVSAFGPFKTGFNDTSTSQSSAYTSLQINNKKGFFTDLGVRFNQHSKYGNNTTFTFNPSYTVSETIRIFGSIASGFKAPSLYQLFDQFSGRPNLQPEKSTTYEAGIAHTLNGFSSRLVVFYRNINNGIDYDYVRSKYFNFVKQTVIGVEYETSTKLSNNLDFRANFSFLSISDSTQSRQSFKDTGYVYGLRRPGININASLNYHQGNFFASVSTKYVSSRYDIGGYKKADVSMAGYLIVNGYAEYTVKQKIKLFADAQNIGNQTFVDLRGFNSIPFMINTGITINL